MRQVGGSGGEGMQQQVYLLGPHDGRVFGVLAPDARGPVADGEEVLRVERVALERVHGPVVARVHAHDLLSRRLALAVARDDVALLGARHELGGLQGELYTYTSTV